MQTTDKHILWHIEELYEQFNECESDYQSIDDSMVEEAFAIMQESSSLNASFESAAGAMAKEYFMAEKHAKALQARISKSLSSKVNEGDRMASFNEEVLKAWENAAELKAAQVGLESTAKYLLRIYYDSKLIYENACRAMRAPVGGEKLVGKI